MSNHFLNRIFFVGALFLVLGCHASRNTVNIDPGNLPNTLLWEIQSDNLESPSYLFGTIHLIPEEMYFWPDHFQNAYLATDQVVLEISDMDMDPAAMMGLMPRFMLPDDQSLENLVSEEDYAKIESYFEEMGLPLQFFTKIKPFFLYLLIDIDMGSLFRNGFKSYEIEISDKAKADAKPLLGLETMDYQISLFDSIPYSDQADMLIQAIEKKTLENDDRTEEDGSGEIYQTYADQDLNAILEAVKESDVVLKKFNKLLLENRNRNWIPKIEKYIHQKPTFIAVGAAHLPGETGVLHLLQKAGYTLKPILKESDGTH